MKLKEPILKILKKQYEPDTMIETTFRRYARRLKIGEDGKQLHKSIYTVLSGGCFGKYPL